MKKKQENQLHKKYENLTKQFFNRQPIFAVYNIALIFASHVVNIKICCLLNDAPFLHKYYFNQ